MKISTKGRYALRMMIDLAQQQKKESCYIPLRDIANRQGIDIKYLEQIVSLLKKDGLIQGRSRQQRRIPPDAGSIGIHCMGNP